MNPLLRHIVSHRVQTLCSFTSIIAVLLLASGPVNAPRPVQALESAQSGVSAVSSAEALPGDVQGSAVPAGVMRLRYFLPLIEKPDPPPQVQPTSCQAITNEGSGELDVIPPPTDRPAEQHADLNLAMRGYASTTATRGLVSYGGSSDPQAPQLPGLFGDNRTPSLRTVYRVYDWNWACNCRGNLLTNWPVTAAGFATGPGEVIRVPDSGYHIGSGYEVLVLYANTSRITLKYMRTDNVVQGYTLHVDNVCVDPDLLARYRDMNANGRGWLPALRGGQPLGYAYGNEIVVSIRDTGTFMDPRSRNDWWRGR